MLRYTAFKEGFERRMILFIDTIVAGSLLWSSKSQRKIQSGETLPYFIRSARANTVW